MSRSLCPAIIPDAVGHLRAGEFLEASRLLVQDMAVSKVLAFFLNLGLGRTVRMQRWSFWTSLVLFRNLISIAVAVVMVRPCKRELMRIYQSIDASCISLQSLMDRRFN
eukprot:496254-Pyramimonas_sp.AAC.1